MLFRIERLVAVFFPLRRSFICSKKINTSCILLLVTFAIAFNSYGFWTSGLGVVEQDDMVVCTTIDKWIHLLKIMALIDTFLTMFLPFLLILSVNMLIIVKLTRNSRNSLSSKMIINVSSAPNDNKPLVTNHSNSAVSASNLLSVPTKLNNSNRNNRHALSSSKMPDDLISVDSASINVVDSRKDSDQDMGRKVSTVSSSFLPNEVSRNRLGQSIKSAAYSLDTRKKQYSRTTRMLLIISTVFLILHGPTAFLKLWYIYTNYIRRSVDNMSPDNNNNNNNRLMETDPVEELLERLTCYIYYLHYSLNFFLYVLNIKNFRSIFLDYCKSKRK